MIRTLFGEDMPDRDVLEILNRVRPRGREKNREILQRISRKGRRSKPEAWWQEWKGETYWERNCQGRKNIFSGVDIGRKEPREAQSFISESWAYSRKFHRSWKDRRKELSENIFPLGRVNINMSPKCKRCRLETQEWHGLQDHLGKKK